MTTNRKPGQRIAQLIRQGETILLPGAAIGTHDIFTVIGEPFEENDEYWVLVRDEYNEDDIIALAEVTFPI